MSKKSMFYRSVWVLAVILLAFALLCLRIYNIGRENTFVGAADLQGSYKVIVATTQGTIYDRNGVPLTNVKETYLCATATPYDKEGYIQKIKDSAMDFEAVQKNLSSGMPFVFEAKKPVYDSGILTFTVNLGDSGIANHIIGYSNNNSGTGIKHYYKDVLEKYSGEISVTFSVDAVGRSLEGDSVKINDTAVNSKGGLILTLDSGIQSATEKAMEGVKGAAIVMDTDGDILAMCSAPSYNAEDLQSAIKDNDSPLLNRALECFNVGSVFKLCLSAAALENDMANFAYDCVGCINVYGQEIGCHKKSGHGLMNIQTALVNSCNPYFIALGQNLGSEKIRTMAEKLSFGKEIFLAEGIKSKAGILPSISELSLPAALANFSIGQGSFLASPLQVAVAVNTIANKGFSVTPRLIVGETSNGKNILNENQKDEPQPVLSKQTANSIKCDMEKVFTEGSVKDYAPKKYTAAGKTSTAQTGIIGDDGKTICQTWLAGFYPSNNPQYTVVVLVEDGISGAKTAGPIFKKILDYIGENCIV